MFKAAPDAVVVVSGESAKVSIKAKEPSEESKAAWLVASDDVAGEADLVDEDALLDGDDAPAPKKAADCSTRRRACKDCSCGRAEREAEEDSAPITDEERAKFVSSCGNVSASPFVRA